MQRFKRINWFVVGCYAIVFALEMALGINIAFVTHALISPAFYDMPAVAIIGAVIAGVLVGFGSFGLFVKTEEAWIAIKDYADHTGEQAWYRIVALVTLNLIVIAVDILGMLYRIQFLASRGVEYLAWIGVGLAFVPILIGFVLTPLVKRPAEMVEIDAIDTFDRTYVTEAYRALEDQPIDVRTKAYNGDLAGALTMSLENKAAADATRRQRGRRQAVLAGRKNNSTRLIAGPTVEAEPVTEELDISKKATGPLTPALRNAK